MYPLTTGEHLEHLRDEYRTLVEELDDPEDMSKLRSLLICEAEWSDRGSAALLFLAQHYGSFVLVNALALAEALDIEDGEAGI